MHEQFSDRARRAFALANQEAVRLRHDFLAPSHILLGILAKGEGIGVMVLRNLNLDLEHLKNEVTRLLEPGDKNLHQTKMAQRADTRQVIAKASDEARKLGHKYIGTEHLLLGMLLQGTNIPARVLSEHQVSAERLRDEILRLLGASKDESHHTVGVGSPPSEWLHQQELSMAFRSPKFWHRLVLAVGEASRLGDGTIEDEHLLLALVREPDTFVARMLAEKGVTLDWLRDRVTRDAAI